MDVKTEIKTAKDWYNWLWLSPMLTIPTLIFVYIRLENIIWSSSLDDIQWTFIVIGLVSVLVSGLWHLILLIPAVRGGTEFIRWHGKQALLLAGVRTLLALTIAGSLEISSSFGVLSFITLYMVWLIGNIWGQGQARRGDCALMRWTGHGGSLPLKMVEEPPAPVMGAELPGPVMGAKDNVDELIGIVRFSTSLELRQAAFAELERRGLVESL